jgi:hypothetical protein
MAASRDVIAARGVIVGVLDVEREPLCVVDIREVVGVVDGEDFVGEIDLARSVLVSSGQIQEKCELSQEARFTDQLCVPASPFDLAGSLPPACDFALRLLDLVCHPFL